MDRNKYFIFSDESGRWADHKCNFYVRSWIKITEERYLYLKGLWHGTILGAAIKTTIDLLMIK